MDDASLRGVSLDFLLDFTWEHSAWHMSTRDVVSMIVQPATAEHRKPYTSLLPEQQVGVPTLFLSHAWSNEFGLTVAAARKFASNGRKPAAAVFVWLDIFAITQHRGEAQERDLSRLEATIARPECTTLVVLDPLGQPLSRCWCVFEFFATLLHAGGRHGKLQVRVGSLQPGGTGELLPCNEVETLAELSAGVDAAKAEATVPEDKAMILARLEELGAASRDGVHELNRKLARAVRHGW
tara:strand:+ start:870 stop:1586 length:717 start_codon:yes stop_codon:yes gene_type:complete